MVKGKTEKKTWEMVEVVDGMLKGDDNEILTDEMMKTIFNFGEGLPSNGFGSQASRGASPLVIKRDRKK